MLAGTPVVEYPFAVFMQSCSFCVFCRRKAAEVEQEQAEKHAAHVAMPEETLTVTSDVKEQRLLAQIRALKQLTEQQETQILELTRTAANAGPKAILVGTGTDSTPVMRSPPQTTERRTHVSAAPALPVSHDKTDAVKTRQTDWELDLAWAAVEGDGVSWGVLTMSSHCL